MEKIATPAATPRLPRPATITSLPWYPVLIAAAFVLNLWVESGISTLAMTRSLATVVVGMAGVIAITALVTRRPHVAGVIALVLFAVLVSRGPIYVVGIVLLAVAIPAALTLWGRIRRAPLSWLRFTNALNLFGVVILVVVLAGGVTRGTLASIPGDLQQGSGSLDHPASDGSGPGTAPDIYVLLLDGHPRSDWLARLFGGDNRAFIDGLRARGFTVAERSTSNYMFTELTLTSMFQMTPMRDIDALQPVFAGTAAGNPLLRNILNDNPVFDLLREHGYRIVTSGPGYEHVALRRADVYLDQGQLNDFEHELLRSTMLAQLLLGIDPSFFADQKRDRVRSGLEQFRAVTADVGPPTFAFIHLPAPHLPVVFDGRGGPAPLPASGDIYGVGDADQLPRQAYADQLAFLDAEVLDAIDDALEARDGRDPPVMLIMSDHGAERRPQVYEGDGTAGNYANLFAALTPGANDLFPDDASPINVFPRLLNHYLGTELGEWPDERYPWLPSP
jgi:hypothetical protein